MDRITFCGGETSGSVGKRIYSTYNEGTDEINEAKQNRLAFYGGETSGSVGKREIEPVDEPVLQIRELTQDTVNFKGRDSEKSSIAGKIAFTAISAGALIAGLGYAHKSNLVGKMKDGKFKDFMRKSDVITEPCHKLCSSIKKTFNKIFKK